MKRVFPAIDESFHRSTRTATSVVGSMVFAGSLALAAHYGWLPIAPTPFITLMASFSAAVLASTWVYYRFGFHSVFYGFMNIIESTVLFVGLAVTITYSPLGHPLLWAFYIIMAVMQAPTTGASITGLLTATVPAAVVAARAFYTSVPGETWQLALSSSVISGLLYWFVGRNRELTVEKLAQAQASDKALAVAQAQLAHERNLRAVEDDWLKIVRSSALCLYYAGEGVRVSADGRDACRLLGGEPEAESFWDEIAQDMARTAALGVPTVVYAKRLPLLARHADIRIVRLETSRPDGARLALLFQDADERVALAAKHQELQDKLVLSDKMASLGVLTAGVAHEISNPLTYILGNLEHVLMNRSLGDDVRQPLLDVQMGFNQIERIVTEMRAFSHARPKPEDEIFDLRNVCLRTERMMAAELRFVAEVTFHLPLTPVLVLGSPERIQQILLNLLINARQALPARAAAENHIDVRLAPGGGEAVLEVSDNGTGIPQDALRRIFDPFFTTKAPGEGTGLGLSVSYQIAKDHGGTIAVQSKPGQGTTFTLKLPQQPAPSQRPRVLVIDDDERNLTLFKRTLHAFDVETATGVREALPLLRKEWDAVLCDVRLADGNGFDLRLKAPAELRPKFLFLTALPPDAPEFASCPPQARLLHKPIQLDLLEQELTNVTSGKSASPVV